jgi:hypothetical protein
VRSDVITAHRSYTSVFYWFAALSFVLHVKQSFTALRDNTPAQHSRFYNFVWNTHTYEETTALNRSSTAVYKVLNAISDHPAISVIGWDVLFSALSFTVWSFVRSLDVNDMLKCSALPFLDLPVDSEEHNDEAEEVQVTHGGRHVKFTTEDEIPDHADDVAPISPTKRRGRPPKSTSKVDGVEDSATSTGTLRRSTRRKRTPDDSEDGYVAPSKTAELASTEHGEGAGDVVEGAEAGALAWGLFVLGGLGVISASVLGAEVRAR